MRICLSLGLLGLLIAIPNAQAASPKDEKELVTKVNSAIDRGVQFLKNAQQNGNWEGYWTETNSVVPYSGGVTALTTLALLNCGVKPDEKEIRSALDYLRTVPRKSTYVVALISMALAEARQPRDLPIIQANTNWLLTTARRKNGAIVGWSYPFGEGAGADGSNTQYALLGLYAGKQAGVKIPDQDWEQIRDHYLKSMKDSGDTASWSYVTGTPPSFTMTVAGVGGLVIAGMGLERSQQDLDASTGIAKQCGKYNDTVAIQKGMNHIGKNFTFRMPRDGSTYYNTYGIERVGRLSGQRFIGKIDWYREGCLFLVGEQNADGGWTQKDSTASYDSAAVISASFALLFLSKGRTPVLISKLAHGDFQMPDNGTLIERNSTPGIVGWNRKHNDVRNLTDFVSRELFQGTPLGWQTYDPRRRDYPKNEDILAEVGVLVQSPILYINGHDALRLKSQQKEILKKYIEEGGFVIAEACCGSPEFVSGYRELMNELFPETPLRKVPPEHPVWQSYFAVPPSEFTKLECMDRGCRTVMIFSPEPLAGYWEESRFMAPKAKVDVNRGELAYRLGGNIVAYATGLELPAQRLSTRFIADPSKEQKNPPKGLIKPAQIKLNGESAPAPAAMRNLSTYLQTNAKLDIVLESESLTADNPDLFKFKFLYMHGRKAFNFSDAELRELKANLQTGGVLFADACCGAKAFDGSFRELATKLFPTQKLEIIPANDELYSKEINTTAITTVKRREKATGADKEAGFQDLPPLLEGIKIDGRWAIIYSKYDIGCALEGHKSSDCLGHTRESALRLASAAMIYSLKK
ncbi:MAG: DUF4159 domain-containing protein [Fimbriiglobus sp.]